MEQEDINKVATGVKVFGGLLAVLCVVGFVFSMTPAGESCYQRSLGDAGAAPAASAASDAGK